MPQPLRIAVQSTRHKKQKAKISYGTQEKQFRRYFKKALTQPGVTGDNLFKLLEMRLDNVVFRLGFAQTRAQARQLVSHGFFEVDGKKVNIPSFSLKVGGQVSVRANKQNSSYMERVKEKLKSPQPQEWLELKPDAFSGKVLGQPTPEMIDSRINAQLIVEHYSRI